MNVTEIRLKRVEGAVMVSVKVDGKWRLATVFRDADLSCYVDLDDAVERAIKEQQS